MSAVEVLECPRCAGPVDSDRSSCPHCGAALELGRCRYCQQSMFAGARACPHCGTPPAKAKAPKAKAAAPDPNPAAPDPKAAAPRRKAAAPALPADRPPRAPSPPPPPPARTRTLGPCPRCAEALGTVRVGSLPVLRCTACHGAWLGHDQLRDILARPREHAWMLQHLQPDGDPPRDGLQSMACPICARPMARGRFAVEGPVIIDLCYDHGMWFDRDELRRAIVYLKQRAASPPEPASKPRQGKPRQGKHGDNDGGHGGGNVGGDTDFGTALGDFLAALLRHL